jgi:hypothetical protein
MNLPVKKTAKQAYICIFNHWGDLLRVAALPLVISILINFTFVPILWSFEPSIGDITSVSNAVVSLLNTLPVTVFGVAWFRTTLEKDRTALSIVPRWEVRHWRFLGYAISASVIFHAPMVILESLAFYTSDTPEPPSLVIISFQYLLLLASIYLIIRCSFVFAATAVNEDFAIRHSWRNTRGQSLRLAGTLLLVVAPIWICTMFVIGLAAQLSMLIEEHIFIFFFPFAEVIGSYAVLAAAIPVIAIAFQVCTGWYQAGKNRVLAK